ncbi:MAG: phosphoribosylanthranilate isomerase [Planctomycetes bacterium]|nr:phosphoribosylanthranilate isomerase [Planctomycetota bacterium]
MTRPHVKICGLRRIEDAALAVESGARALGCVLASDSPRRASTSEARALVTAFGDHMPVVLVFRGATRDEVLQACERTGAREVQLHESPESLCLELEERALRVWRVLGVEGTALPTPCVTPDATRPLVLDSAHGGSGRSFDWSLLSQVPHPGVFVAGGITPDNVAALCAHDPYGIDLSSGVESAPGVKDGARMRALFANLKAAHR